jgi:hypothetical protein
MLNSYLVEKVTNEEIITIKVLAMNSTEAIVLAFGGSVLDYFECYNVLNNDVLYMTESNNVYESFGRIEK